MKIFNSNSTIKPLYKEYIGSGKWRFRWNIIKNEDDLYLYKELEENRDLDISEIKQIIIEDLKNNNKPNEFYLDNLNCWLSEENQRNLLEKCRNTDSDIKFIANNNLFNLKVSQLFQLLNLMGNYNNEFNYIIDNLIININNCNSLEEINNLDFNLNLPEIINIKSEDLLNNTSKEYQLYVFVKDIMNTLDLSNNQALTIKNLFPNWENFIGKSLNKDFKVLYNGSLYKVTQDIEIVTDPPIIKKENSILEFNNLYELIQWQS